MNCPDCGGKGYLVYEGDGLYIRNPCRKCDPKNKSPDWNIPKGVKLTKPLGG